MQGRFLMATVAAAILSGASGSGAARAGATDNPFSALVGKARERTVDERQGAAIERYVLASDDRAFLFQDFGDEARVKFLCGSSDERFACGFETATPEIHLLQATRAPRGDVIYKNVEGDTFLRIASYGGATVYWPGEEMGLAASKSFGESQSLSLTPASYARAASRAKKASAFISAIVGAPITFEFLSPRDMSADATVLADAIIVAAKGIAHVAQDRMGAAALAAQIDRVRFQSARQPGISLTDETLDVFFVPDRDIEGRPSSAAMRKFLEETL